MSDIQAIFEKSKRIGGDDLSLDGIPGDDRGIDYKGGETEPIRVTDICRIIENGSLYYFQYVAYTGETDDINYIRPVTNPDLTKAWKLIDSLAISTLTKETTFKEKATFEKDVEITGTLTASSVSGVEVAKLKELYMVGDNIITSTDFNITPASQVREYIYRKEATGNGIFTFGTLTTDHDGKIFAIRNLSWFYLSIKAQSSISIGTSGKGYGIDMLKQGWVKLKYDHARLTMDIVASSGACQVENCDLYIPMSTVKGNNADEEHLDLYMQRVNSPEVVFTNGGLFYNFNGSNQRLSLQGSTEKFNNILVGDFTISGWVIFDHITNGYPLHIMFGGNQSDAIRVYVSSGTLNIIITHVTGGSITKSLTASAGALNYLTIAKKENNIGYYLNGVQGNYSSYTGLAFSGTVNVVLASYYNGTVPFDGKLSDWVFCRQNLFNANPQSDFSDIINVPKSPEKKMMNLVGL
ncbi:MAG: LamG domain-containing protein [Deltaproteobacteria bacterium]|nr:LamG domain-containing protein [Deltaproteobacteria bacterium]